MAITFKDRDNRPDAFNVRASVFMVEQGFTYDFDGLDDNSGVIFITAYDDASDNPSWPVATARIFPAELEAHFPEDMDAGPDSWVVGRIAVRPEYRHTGLGSRILAEAERVAAANGAADMHLHAQVRAMGFYHHNGYVEYGPYGYDEGVPHQWMKKPL